MLFGNLCECFGLSFDTSTAYACIFQAAMIGLLDKVNPSSMVTFTSSSKITVAASTTTNTNDGSMKRSSAIPRLFECTEEGCIRSFAKFGNLLIHLTVGNHCRLVEKFSLLDTAKKTYQSKLGVAEKRRLLSLSLEQVSFDPNDYDLPELHKGWELPIACIHGKFTVKQKEYMNVCAPIADI